VATAVGDGKMMKKPIKKPEIMGLFAKNVCKIVRDVV